MKKREGATIKTEKEHLEAAKKVLQEEAAKRVDAAIKEIDEILKKYDCKYQMTQTIQLDNGMLVSVPFHQSFTYGINIVSK